LLSRRGRSLLCAADLSKSHTRTLPIAYDGRIYCQAASPFYPARESRRILSVVAIIHLQIVVQSYNLLLRELAL